MDLGAINLFVVEVIGAALLGLVILYVVIRTKSGGKKDSNPTTEQATRDLYQEEDREAKRNGDV